MRLILKYIIAYEVPMQFLGTLHSRNYVDVSQNYYHDLVGSVQMWQAK